MKKRHNTVWIAGLALAVIMIAGVCFGAYGDSRFYGGSYDGHATASITNTSIGAGVARGSVVILR